MRTLLPIIAWLTTLLALSVVSLACSKEEEAKTAADVSTKVADGVCKEEAQQPNEPAWVALACAAEAPASGIVHVLMPREQWDVARGRKPAPCTSVSPLKPTFDAGPGK